MTMIEEGMATRISALGHERDDGGGVGRSAKGYRSNSVNLAITNISSNISLGQVARGWASVVTKLVRLFPGSRLAKSCMLALAGWARRPAPRARVPARSHPACPEQALRLCTLVRLRPQPLAGLCRDVTRGRLGVSRHSGAPPSTLHEWPAGCLPICACSPNRWLACGPRASEQCPCRRLR